MAAAFQKDSCRSWLYLIVVCLVTFFTIGFLDSYGVFLVYLVDHYNESNSKTAWLGSLAYFCTFSLYPFTLYMREKLGHRVIVLFAGALVLPTFLLSPSMPTMNFLFLTFSVPFGVTCCIVECAAFTTVLECFEKYKGVAFGLRIGAGALGTMVYSFSLPLLMSEIGWKMTFWNITAISSTCVFYAFVYRRPTAECSVGGRELIRVESGCTEINVNLEGVMQDKDKEGLQMYYKLLQDKKFIVFLLASITFTAVALMPPIFMVRFATNIGYHISKAKWLMIARSMASVVTRFTVGRLGDMASKYKKIKYIVLICMALFSVSTLLCSMTTNFSLFILYMVFVSIMDSVYWIIQPLFIIEVTRGICSDKAFALLNCIGSFSMLGGPPALGWFYDITQDFNSVLYITSAVSAIAACFMVLGIRLSTNDSPSSEEVKFNHDTNVLGIGMHRVVPDQDIFRKFQQPMYISAV